MGHTCLSNEVIYTHHVNNRVNQAVLSTSTGYSGINMKPQPSNILAN